MDARPGDPGPLDGAARAWARGRLAWPGRAGVASCGAGPGLGGRPLRGHHAARFLLALSARPAARRAAPLGPALCHAPVGQGANTGPRSRRFSASPCTASQGAKANEHGAWVAGRLSLGAVPIAPCAALAGRRSLHLAGSILRGRLGARFRPPAGPRQPLRSPKPLSSCHAGRALVGLSADDLLGQLQIGHGALGMDVVADDRLAEARGLGQAHVARHDGLEQVLRESLADFVLHLV